MINFTGKILLRSTPTDLRKSIDGLAILVEEIFNLNPMDEIIFVFYNRGRDKIKILWWNINGFCLFYKRLEKQRFKIPFNIKDKITLEARELRWLLDGLDLSKIKAHKKLNYKNFY